MIKQLTTLLILFLSLQINAAYLPLQYTNSVYESSIKTVILRHQNSLERFPAIDLNSSQQMVLEFDDLMPENDDFQFTFIHCSADWQPSNLRKNEYLSGNFFENVLNYSFSTATFQVFTHYNVPFPTNEMKPILSGNYLLLVYRNFDESDIVLSRRFMVVDDKFVITPSVKIASNASDRFTSQEVDFTVNIGENRVPNPMMDIKTTIMQNLRWDNAIFDLKPRFINGKILDYNYESGNLFLGGNEFRFFDIRNLRFLSFNVRRKYMEENLKNAVLYNDATKMNLPYLQMIDFNGKIVVDNRDGGLKGEIESDYAKVHFTFISDKLEKDVYIFGEISDWQIKEEFKMEWNEKFLQYEKSMMLKQAYYNYYYVTPNDKGQAELKYTENNFSNTENDYHIMVYHKNQFMQYDELLGTVYANSMKK
ncbi:MAG: DUF5103 domain-containing protein [Bacteroidota bacterium]|nr:DUF5103 domain-containing protein [Bacteroidota bacterium]